MKIKIEPGARVQITDKPIYNIFGDVVQQKIVQGVDANKRERQHFPLNNTIDEGFRLFNELKEEKFMQCSIDSWLFLMGFSEQEPLRVNMIKWLGTKEQLRVMLRMLFDTQINEKALSVADLERLTPLCFIDKKGKPMNLAKQKDEISQRMEKLKEIFRPYTEQ